ncbi:hypothetical protein ACWAST_003116 [Klebsiella quasipneumoniae]
MNVGVEWNVSVIKAITWLAKTTTDPREFSKRLEQAQTNYINETSKKTNFGAQFDKGWYGDDVVAGFFSQAKSLIDNRRAFEISMASHIIPWMYQLGLCVDFLDNVSGAVERARRMLESNTVYPDTAMFELILAGNYAAIGYEVEFIPERKGIAKTPDLKCSLDGGGEFFVECKRLQKGPYSVQEENAHFIRAKLVEGRVHSKRMSVWMDVTYKSEVISTPENYLVNHLSNYYGKDYHWDDDYGTGFVKASKLQSARNEVEANGSLSFHTKLARLLKGSALSDDFFNVFAFGQPDERDPRFISKIKYASLLTWRCINEVSFEKRSRHITNNLSEIEKQISNYGVGVGHIAMDVDVQRDVADKRREKNLEATKSFKLESKLVRFNIHYLVPRIDENHSWMVDETLDYFYNDKIIHDIIPAVRIFPEAAAFNNDLPGWHQ